YIIAMSRKLGKKSRSNPASNYPEVLTSLTEADVMELGERYLESTRVQRRKAPFFIDKMPNNFQHVGLIHLILPNAKIVDARRHPMAGSTPCHTQPVGRGQTLPNHQAEPGGYNRAHVNHQEHRADTGRGSMPRLLHAGRVTE